jgi:cyclohexanecarboxylate-CoA ligase
MPSPVTKIVPTWRPPPDRIEFYRAARFWRGASVPDNLQLAAARFGDKAAVRDDEGALTFEEILSGAQSVATWLRAQGLQTGEAVVFQIPNWREAAFVFHGILMAGGVAVPVTTILRQREVSFILAQTGARFAFVSKEFRRFDFSDLYDGLVSTSSLEQVVWVRCHERLHLDDVLATPSASVAALEEWRGHGDDAAVVIYTSGTTSDPKGAIHTHDGLLASTRMCQEWFSFNERDVLFNPSPLTHITGISMTFLFPVTFGCAVTIQAVWDPQRAFETVQRDRTTYLMFATPFLQALTEIAEERDLHLDHIRTIVCGGADVPRSLSERARVRLGEVVRMYGATEAPNTSCGSPWDSDQKKWGTEGRWIFPTETRVVDPGTGLDVGPDEVGEAWWRAPQMCNGYLDETLNADSYTPDGYFRTGDLVRVDAEGFVTVSGRIKEIINRGGEKFSAREIEELVLQLPGVAEVAVTPVSDAVLGEKVCAWVVLREGHALTLGQLVDHLTSLGLARQKMPERLEAVPEFPRTPSGKIRKHELRDRVDATLT